MNESGGMIEYDPATGEVRNVATIRVRIAVAVDADGRYRAEGWGGAVDWAAEERVRDSLRHFGAAVSVHWFEHDVPLPLASSGNAESVR